MKLDFDTDGGAAARAALGLIVLATDETMEPELATILPQPGVALQRGQPCSYLASAAACRSTPARLASVESQARTSANSPAS